MNEHEEQHNHGHRHGPGQGHGPWRGGRRGPFGHGMQHGSQGRDRWHGRGRDHDWQDFFGGQGGPFGGGGGPFGFGGRPGPRGRHGFGGGRERLERGLLRYIILDALKDTPKHGYEIIKLLEEKTQGAYSPSPGTLYPTLQYLEDLGWVRSDQEAERRVYNLTDAGHTELDSHARMVEEFWSRFGDRTSSVPNLYELKFAGDALKDLLRTLGEGIKSAALTKNPDTARKIRQALEKCQNEVREIIAQAASTPTADEAPEK